MPRTKKAAEVGAATPEIEVWYLALRKLHIVQGPGTTPSTIRFHPGQRFALDGNEPVDVESLLRIGAIKVYEDSDEEWAQEQLMALPEEARRSRNRG